MDVEVGGQVRLIGVGDAGPSNDAGVVDEDVDPPEAFDGGVDEGLGSGARGHVADVGDGRPAGGDDLGRHGGRHISVGADTVPRPPQVVDDNPRTSGGQKHGIGPPDTAAGSGDGGDSPSKLYVLTAHPSLATVVDRFRLVPSAPRLRPDDAGARRRRATVSSQVCDSAATGA